MLFVHTRQKYPRLNLKPIVSVHEISDSERLLRFGLELENVGNVLASLRECEVWIQQLKPWPEEVLLKDFEKIQHYQKDYYHYPRRGIHTGSDSEAYGGCGPDSSGCSHAFDRQPKPENSAGS